MKQYILENMYHFAYLLLSLHVMGIHFPVLLCKCYYFIFVTGFIYVL